MRACSVCVGSNFNFGYRGSGSVKTLRESGHGLEVIEVPPVEVRHGIVSSTRVRELISWFDGFWKKADSLDLPRISRWEKETDGLRRAYAALRKRARAKPACRCLRHQSTGAEAVRDLVKTPATCVPGASATSSVSARLL